MKLLSTLAVVVVVVVGGAVRADDGAKPCTAAVKAAIGKAFPKSTIASCKPEHEDGHDQFEVKLTKQDGGKLEVDVSPEGAILQVEESIPLDKLPAAVTKAFGAKYPKAKPSRAEKQTRTNKGVLYEVAFQLDGKGREATFTESGQFVEEE